MDQHEETDDPAVPASFPVRPGDVPFVDLTGYDSADTETMDKIKEEIKSDAEMSIEEGEDPLPPPRVSVSPPPSSPPVVPGSSPQTPIVLGFDAEEGDSEDVEDDQDKSVVADEEMEDFDIPFIDENDFDDYVPEPEVEMPPPPIVRRRAAAPVASSRRRSSAPAASSGPRGGVTKKRAVAKRRTVRGRSSVARGQPAWDGYIETNLVYRSPSGVVPPSPPPSAAPRRVCALVRAAVRRGVSAPSGGHHFVDDAYLSEGEI